jgi:PPP family 3-phenylpropionic acid transporter
MIGALADRLGQRRTCMIALAGITMIGLGGLWNAYGFWALLSLALVAEVAQSAMMPLADSITLASVRCDGLDYGRVRLWGSVSFILAAIASGAILGHAAKAGPAGDAVLALVLAAACVLFFACLAVPTPPAESADQSRWAALGALAGDRRFWIFVPTVAFLQASHQVFYGFGTLYWRSLGISDAMIGCLWAEGVLAEIVLFWQGGRLLARIGPLGLLAAGGGAGILRWALMGFVPGLPAAVLLQLLHALTFGATHLGAMSYLSRTVPSGAAASAQALYAGASAGIGGTVMLGAGALYTAYGGRAYLFMALLSAAGLFGVARLVRNAGQWPHLV